MSKKLETTLSVAMGAFVLDMHLMCNMIVGIDAVGDVIWNLTHTVKLLVFKLCTIGFLV
jgi:hypothetical protein